jgi:hypothetical protein
MEAKSVPFWRRGEWLRWRKLYIQKTPEQERRAWIRYPSNAEAICEDTGSGQLLQARVRNISLGGMSLLVKKPIGAGTALKVEVPSLLEETPRQMWVRVLYLTAEAGGQWGLGCVFTQPIGADHLAALRADMPRPPEPEPRAAVRHPCDIVTSCRPAAADDDGQLLPARIRDISVLGLGVLIRYPYRAGTRLLMELPGRNGHAPRTVLATVVHARPQPGGWIVGCSLAQPLAEEDLQALLA